jgi:hypothetical protein
LVEGLSGRAVDEYWRIRRRVTKRAEREGRERVAAEGMSEGKRR